MFHAACAASHRPAASPTRGSGLGAVADTIGFTGGGMTLGGGGGGGGGAPRPRPPPAPRPEASEAAGAAASVDGGAGVLAGVAAGLSAVAGVDTGVWVAAHAAAISPAASDTKKRTLMI
jgi:hypothetical protein